MKGIILHGGHGTRLRPLTHTGPKQLLPIANKPMSEYCIDSLKNAKITEIAIVIGGIGSKRVKEYYGNGMRFGINITYIEQDSPKGIAHAISLCKNFVNNEKFIVFLGDNIMHGGINNFVEKFQNSNLDALLLLCEVSNPEQFGVAEIKNKKIKRIIEKPKNPPSNFAVTGIYFLTEKIFKAISFLEPSWINELEISDAIQKMIDNNNNVDYEIITDFWKDTGTPQDIIKANTISLKNQKCQFFGTKDNSSNIVGVISTGKGTIIKNNSKLIGPVKIGKNCIIDSECQIGPNVSIGDNCILSSCKIENSIIMSDCIIDSSIHLQKSILGKNCKIISKELSQKNDVFLLGEGTNIIL